MKGKMKKRLLALAVVTASIMSAPGLLAANAAENVAAGAGTSEGAAAQPMEANGFVSPDGEAAEITDSGAEISFGVVSDTHVREDKETEKSRFAKAAKFFSDAGMDRMVVAGDLTDNGSDSEYDAWGRIIQDNLSIPLIASMGNHENNSADYFKKTTGNKPNDHQVVNGYHFITLSPGKGDLDPATGKGTTQGGGNYTYAVEWLEQQLLEAQADTPDKPIFVFFHHPIKNTFYVSNEWYGSGLDEVFKSHPHAVTFSGHIHSPNNMPTSIWQDGGYTAVNTVTLSYMEAEKGMIYGSIPPNASEIAQGLVVEASGSRVTIKNYDFLADQWIPQTWTFDVNDTLPYTDERRDSANAPYFDEDAQLTVSEVGDDSAKLTFDQAKVAENNVGDLVHSYKYDFINTKTQAVVKTFKTWSNYYIQPMPLQIEQAALDLEGGTSYEVRIYAIDAYQKMSEDYLSQTFKTTGESTSEPGFDDMVTGVPEADLLDVDFSDGRILDHSESGNTFTGSDGSNISMDESLGKYAATFTGKTEEAFLTDWSLEQYDKINDSFTIESTFKVDKFAGGYVDLFANMDAAGIGFEIPSYDEESASLEAWVHIGGSYKRPIATGRLKYGEWNHGAITYDGSRVTLYLNGQKIASMEASGEVKTPSSGSQYYVIGGDSGSDGSVQSPMVGAMSTARLYSKALTAKQVSMLANRDLTSIDKMKPVIQTASAPASSGTINADYTIPAAQAADNSTAAFLTAVVKGPQGNEIVKLGGDSSKTEETTFKPVEAGTYQLIYTAVDPAGNTETNSFEIEVKAGDRSKLDEAIIRAASISDEELAAYTEESVADLMTALQKAMDITAASSQAEIDAAAKALNDAIDGLEKKQEKPQADKTQLKGLYEEVKGITGAEYTAGSYAVLDSARTKALEVLNSETADQAAVDEAYEELKNAKEGLKVSELYVYIENILAAVEGADTTNASEEAVKNLDLAAKELEGMLTDHTVKENVRAAKAIEVLRAMGGLEPGIPNVLGLELGIQSAEALNQFAYTQISWAVFESACSEAETVLNELKGAKTDGQTAEDGNMAEGQPAEDGIMAEGQPAENGIAADGQMQNLQQMNGQTEENGKQSADTSAYAGTDADRADKALENLGSSLTGLVEKSSELLVKLNESIAKADAILAKADKYTPNSLNGLKEARDAAKALVETGSADEAEINDARTTLDTILNQVKNRADKLKLAVELARASLIKVEEYTKDSAAAFTKAYEEAKAVNDDLNISDQAAVDHAAAALEDAMGKLVKKEGNPGNNGGNNDGQNNGNHNQNEGSNGGSGTGSGKNPPLQATGAISAANNAVKTGDGELPILPAIAAVAGLVGMMGAAVLKKKYK